MMTSEIVGIERGWLTEKNRPDPENWRCADLLPPQEVLLAVREGGTTPILNLKNPHATCPGRCVYCDVRQERGKVLPLIPEADLRRTSTILDILQEEHGLRAVEFCGDGEPLSDWRLVSRLLEGGLKLSLFTSGVYLSQKRAELLITHEAIIKIKLDALDPKLFGRILLDQSLEADSEKAETKAGKVISSMSRLLKVREEVGKSPGRLIASVVVTNMNFPAEITIEESPLAEVLRFCRESLVIPQVNYVEQAGGNLDNRYGIEDGQVREANQYLRELYEVDPKILGGENCFAMFAPILTTSGLMATGPFGMGCEFPLREHIGKLGEIRILTEPKDFNTALLELEQFRRSQENRKAVIEELIRIRERQGVYGLSGSDDILPGCGAGVEENYFLVYAATLFGGRDYFERRILLRTDDILIEKWTPGEVAELINQIS